MKRSVYKLTALHVDLNGNGPFLIGERLRETQFSSVIDIESCEVEWTDQHPLNIPATQRPAFDKLFGPTDVLREAALVERTAIIAWMELELAKWSPNTTDYAIILDLIKNVREGAWA